MPGLHDLPLTGLRALLAVSKDASVGGAAAMLGVTPGAVSHQIRALEERLGVRLLLRHGPRVELTAAARGAIADLDRGFDGLLAAHAILQAADQRAPFRISVDTSFASVWLMPRIPELRRLLVGRDVSIVPLDHALGDRLFLEADLAITYRAIPEGTKRLAARALMTDRMVALTDGATAAALASPRSPQTLATLPLIEVDPAMGDALYPGWADWFAAAGLAMPADAVQTRVGLSRMAVQAASEGLGAALVPNSVAEGIAATPGVREIGQDGPGIAIERRLVWRREGPNAGAAEAVAAALAATSGAPVAPPG